MADLKGLHPYVKQQTEKLLEAANKRIAKGGYTVRITQAFRSKEEQDKLYAQGRTAPGQKVTNAKGGQSMHNFGLAIDFCLISPDGKKAIWDTNKDFDGDKKADWMEVVEEAKKLGFEWGGDWKSFKDYPHFQLTAGLTDAEVRAGKTPKFPSLDGEKTVTKKATTAKKTTTKKAVKKYVSLVDFLVANGQPYDFVSRVKLAKKHGITNYNGTAEQNIKLLNILQK